MRFEGNYYKLLELDASASAADIKRAYQALALRYHPDHNPDDAQAGARFRDIQKAYRTLGNPQLRAHYDALGKHAAAGADGEALVRAFERLAKLVVNKARPVAPQPSELDITLTIEVPQHATQITSQTVFYSRRVPCACDSDASCAACRGLGWHYVSARREVFVHPSFNDGALVSIGQAGHSDAETTGVLHVVLRFTQERRAL